LRENNAKLGFLSQRSCPNRDPFDARRTLWDMSNPLPIGAERFERVERDDTDYSGELLNLPIEDGENASRGTIKNSCDSHGGSGSPRVPGREQQTAEDIPPDGHGE
jgi:hypothetical protein